MFATLPRLQAGLLFCVLFCSVLSCPCLPWTIVAFIVLVLVLVVVVFMPQCPSKYLLFQRRPFAGRVFSATATLCNHLHASLASILSCTSSFYCCCCFYCCCQRGVSFPAPVPCPCHGPILSQRRSAQMASYFMFSSCTFLS